MTDFLQSLFAAAMFILAVIGGIAWDGYRRRGGPWR